MFKRMTAFIIALVLCLSVAATALAAYSTIPYGTQSNAVREMQNALKKKGFYPGAVDGKFGPATKKAVIKYQNYIGITPDGKPGNKTLTALYHGKSAINKADNTELKHQINPSNPRTLYYGCTGDRVKSLQRALVKAGVYKGAIDGIFGDLTLVAVKKYQQQKGLHADGLAGVKTLASLRLNTGASISGSMLLSVGSKGEEVRSLKAFLSSKGFNAGMTVGDDYTEAVAQNVKAWQAANGLKETGTITEAQYNDILLNQAK